MKELPRLLIAALLGTVLTGAGAWLTWARDVVTEAKAIDLIERHNPYLEDRKILFQGLEELAAIRRIMDEQRMETVAIRVLLQERTSSRGN